MSDKLNIEELISSKLGETEITPSPGAWKSIQRKLRWRQFMRFDPGKFNIFYMGGLLIAGAGLIALFSTKSQDSEAMALNSGTDANYQQVITNQIEEPEVEIQESEAGNVEPGHILRESQEQKSKGAINQEISINSPEDQLHNSEETVIISDDDRSTDFDGQELEQQTMVAYFTCSVHSGCAPLSVKFFNQSVHATSFQWSLGTGEINSDHEPVYLYNEPGKYTVMLTAQDAQGLTSTVHQVIEVFPAPSAEFEIEEGLVGIDGLEELDFINYSVGANSYAWNLMGKSNKSVSKWLSNEFQPSVKLSDLGMDSRYIRLVTTNEFGCTDSSIQVIPDFTSSMTPTLKFPTAFSPNPTGPAGGSYSPHEKRIDIFHPVFKEVPLTYKLRIYTRRGELVFETDNIYLGWDGYHHQQQSAGGVYVWMTEGTWENGEEFTLQGDVTLIWNDQR